MVSWGKARRIEWLQMLEAQEATGLSVSAWCRLHGITLSQFTARRRLLHETGIEVVKGWAAAAEKAQGMEEHCETTEKPQAKHTNCKDSSKETQATAADGFKEFLTEAAVRGKVYLAEEIEKGYLSADRLRAILEYRHGVKPEADCFYLFRGKDTHTLHIVSWDAHNTVTHMKRWSEHRCGWPKKNEGIRRVHPEMMASLLG